MLTCCRSLFGWTKKHLAQALGWKDDSNLSDYERGKLDLSRPRLLEILAPLPLEDPELATGVLDFAHRMIYPEPRQDPAWAALSTGERRSAVHAAVAGGLATAETIYAAETRRRMAERAEAARREARVLWARLQAVPPNERRSLIAAHPEFRSVAPAAHVCEASVRAAAGNLGKARELAELALFIADRMKEPLRSRAQGYCWAFIANVSRVAEDFDGADEAFARAWKLWEEGVGCEFLSEGRLLDLEASLRRAERRFPEALKLLDRARAASGEDPTAVSRVLLEKESVLDYMGDVEGALAALAEAAPFAEASGDPRMLIALRFKSANHLVGLERFDEAAELLPCVREMALEQHNELDLIRVMWLAARVAAGKDSFEEAVEGLQIVRRDFLDHELPYDAALASLDLAVVWLYAGHTAEVQELAAEMEAVFLAKRIGREALAALLLFCEAAKREAATVELAKHAIADIEKVRRSASSAK